MKHCCDCEHGSLVGPFGWKCDADELSFTGALSDCEVNRIMEKKCGANAIYFKPRKVIHKKKWWKIW
jgi:hypothetical protein